MFICLCLLPGLGDQSTQGSWQVFTKDNGLPSNYMFSILEDSKGNIWCTTQGGGVAKYDGNTWEIFNEANGLIDNFVNESYVDRKGNVWFFRNIGSGLGVRYGITRYDGNKLDTSKKPLLVRKIYEDRAGNIWLCTNEGLLNWKSSEDFKTFGDKEGLAHRNVFTVFEDSANRLWVGTKKGISVYDGATWVTYDDKNGATDETVIEILEDKAGSLWFGTKGGIFRFDGKDWTNFTKENGLPGNDVLFMKMDSQGRIWASMGGSNKEFDLISALAVLIHRSGIVRFDGGEMIIFSVNDGAPSSKVTEFHMDSRDNIWCDTYTAGVYQYDGNQWREHSRNKGFFVNHFTGFTEARNGHIWLSTASGILCYDRENWTHITTKEGLLSNNTDAIMEDSKGNIWIGTMRGLVKYSR
jgi:ligand-binding sensor domain-containing protein